MKQQIATALAGLMLLTSGFDYSGKQILGVRTQNKKSNSSSPEKGSEKNIHGKWQGTSAPNLYDGGVFARADFLYWRADEEGLQYGCQGEVIQTGSQSGSAKMVSPETKWSPGFRLGLGYTFAQQDYWDLTAFWTHFQTHQTGSFHNHGDNSNLIVPWWGSDLGAAASFASANWKLNYNIYDLQLGRNYFIAKTFSVHPFIGLRGATIDQHYHAKYHGLFDAEEIPTSFKAKNDFWGIGAHLGTGLQWYCSPSFSLIGQVGGSLLYANFHIAESAEAVLGSSGNTVAPFPSEHITTAATQLEALLGVQWEKFFYNNKWRFVISLGYEWNQWFSQNRITRASRVASLTNTQRAATLYNHENGNLALQGATLQARLDF